MNDTDTDTDTDGEYTCEACETSFESEAKLERHVREVGLVE